MKKWMIFFVIVAALLVGANSYAPQLAEAGLCQALSATLNLHSDDVRVQASPGAKIFLGDIDAITVHANNFQAGDLTFAHFDCTLRRPFQAAPGPGRSGSPGHPGRER